MKNALAKGDVIDYTVPNGQTTTSGSPVVIGAVVGVAVTSNVAGEVCAVNVSGTYNLPKAAAALTQGAKVYWDDTAKLVTTSAASGANMPLGFVWKAAVLNTTVVEVNLRQF